MTTEMIHKALRSAALAHGLRVQAHPDLGGASVTSPMAQAYVYPRTSGGYTVDLWKDAAFDAVQVNGIEDLASAVRLAMTGVLGYPP